MHKVSESSYPSPRTLPAPAAPSHLFRRRLRSLFRFKFHPLPHCLTGIAHPLKCHRSPVRERRYSRSDSQAALKTRLASTDKVDRNRTVTENRAMDDSETLAGKRDRAPVDVTDISEESDGNQEKRCRVGDIHVVRFLPRRGTFSTFQTHDPNHAGIFRRIRFVALGGRGSHAAGGHVSGDLFCGLIPPKCFYIPF